MNFNKAQEIKAKVDLIEELEYQSEKLKTQANTLSIAYEYSRGEYYPMLTITENFKLLLLGQIEKQIEELKEEIERL